MKCSSCGFIEDRHFIAVGGYDFPKGVKVLRLSLMMGQ
ncbi:hypothetical protein TSIB_1753 [Thermococcus sibiricus MM 739]|uniref:Uncharacterized protein n=1 Tax=Thermococcus sibiricus (strain DSM 12597 / MM 739) TaxID=604354 RepID=C6A5A9_THESM|nr:hypothetical protein TSIB_1753 [Thermococcus sibiricus MM 739]